MLEDIMTVSLVPYGNAEVMCRSQPWIFVNVGIITGGNNYKMISFILLVPLQEKLDGEKYKFECQHGPQECLGNMIEVRGSLEEVSCHLATKSNSMEVLCSPME